jgi:hypothetical protein
MNDKLVFCTSYLEGNPQRYQDWINYYTKFFEGCGVDLMMINDGPVNQDIDRKDVELLCFDKRLGRETVWIFPGWKRSYFTAMKYASRYKRIGHVESDCFITLSGRKEFLYHLDKDGFYTGFTKTYNFPETCLQVINDDGVRQYVIDKYYCEENWYENIDFEQDIARLKPKFILDGDRIENDKTRFKPSYTFLSGVTLNDFEGFYGAQLLLL